MSFYHHPHISHTWLILGAFSLNLIRPKYSSITTNHGGTSFKAWESSRAFESINEKDNLLLEIVISIFFQENHQKVHRWNLRCMSWTSTSSPWTTARRA